MPIKLGMRGAWLLLALLLTACDRNMPAVSFHAEGYPPKLSDWHVVEARDGVLQLNTGVVPYDLNTPLFSDYAHKLRTIWMPKGVSARYSPTDTFDFPVGTIISKTFFYPLPKGEARNATDVARTSDTSRDLAGPGQGLELAQVHLVETRLLVRRKQGWVAIPYVWNAQQTEALLARTGDVQALTLVSDNGERENFNYVVPDQSQCASCHARDWTTRAIQPIGPKARHLNRDYRYAEGDENELAHLLRVGYLSGAPAPADAPRNANWTDKRASLDARARAYLDINCGHCHNPKGAANTTGLTLDIATPEDRHIGICKPPTAAGQGTGDHLFDIVPGHPDDSILPYRLGSAEPGTMMPEIGRSTVHREGLALIKAWIAAQAGECQVLH
jgi:uncharacterized repeat protein (TIGR03806 family)